MVKSFITKSPLKTKKLGEILAKEALKTSLSKKPLFLDLEGDLGGGKTTFLQGFARGLGVKEKITSPTFVIMRRFQVLGPRFQFFYHIDCYRIENPKEILDLGFKKIISNPQNIIAVEWADKIKEVMPKDAMRLKFEFMGKNSRRIMIELKKNGK